MWCGGSEVVPNEYQVTITMPDGSCGSHVGAYHDQAAAAGRATDLFPEAARISVLRASTAQRRFGFESSVKNIKEVSHGQQTV